MTKPTFAAGPSYRLTASFPKAARLLGALRDKLEHDDGSPSIIRAMSLTLQYMADWNGEGSEPAWVLIADRDSMNACAWHCAILERDDENKSHIAALRTFASAVKTFLKDAPSVKPAPEPVNPDSVDMTTDFFEKYLCECPNPCKRCTGFLAQRAVREQENAALIAKDADGTEDVSVFVREMATRAKVKLAAQAKPERQDGEEHPSMILPDIMGEVVKLFAVDDKDAEHVNSLAAYLVTTATNYRRQHDETSHSARQLANEIESTLNALRLVGALRDRPGVEHIPAYNTAQV